MAGFGSETFKTLALLVVFALNEQQPPFDWPPADVDGAGGGGSFVTNALFVK